VKLFVDTINNISDVKEINEETGGINMKYRSTVELYKVVEFY
jgi:hypothetical protein